MRHGAEANRFDEIEYDLENMNLKCPPSVDDAEAIRLILNTQLNEVKHKLSGFKVNTGRKMVIFKRNSPERQELLDERKKLLRQKKDLKSYFGRYSALKVEDIRNARLRREDPRFDSQASEFLELLPPKGEWSKLSERDQERVHLLRKDLYHRLVVYDHCKRR